ncbi:MAG TPA: Cof-type HAD-IIB family hydrolase [Bacillales bacterium]
MGRKMVFFDLDGTLLDEDKRIVPSAKEAIHRLKDEGVAVAIATGRAPFMFAEFQKELGIDAFVSFNGQYVVAGDDVVYKNPLNYEALTDLDRAADANGHPMVFLNHVEMRATQPNHEYIEKSIGDLRFPYPQVDPGFYHGQDIFQALLFCRDKDESLYEANKRGIEFIRWHDLSLDVIPEGGSKANGLKRLLQHFDIRREDAYAFGDGLNDIQMLSYVGTGVAMGNAKDETKQAADFVTRKMSEDGIVHGLQTLKLLG